MRKPAVFFYPYPPSGPCWSVQTGEAGHEHYADFPTWREAINYATKDRDD